MEKNQNFLNLKFIFRGAITCAVFTFLLVFFFGLIPKESPKWYSFLLYFIEETSFFCACFLCIRNWRYPRLISNRTIWLVLAIGLCCQGLGNIIFNYWELILKREPSLSIANIFYVVSYTSIVSGIFLAVRYRAINLSKWQWGMVGFAATIAISLAVITNTPPAQNAYLPSNLLTEKETILVDFSQELSFSNSDSNIQLLADLTQQGNAPQWAILLEKMIEPFINIFNIFYVIADILMLTMASTLLITFWGGRFSQTWLAISLGALSFYIGDIWYAYSITYTGQSPRGLIDFLWTFSALCYVVGAAFEYDISWNLRSRN